MKMTGKLANQLMDDLMCVAISATGGAVLLEDGSYDEKQMEYCGNYARNTFCELLEAWEELMNEKWEIEVETD